MFGKFGRIHGTRGWQFWVCSWSIVLLLLGSLGLARSGKTEPFSAAFEGILVDADIGPFRAEVQLKGNVVENKLGEGTFDAQGYLNLATETGQGKVTIHFNEGTIKMQVSGYQVEANRFAGIYRILEGTDDDLDAEGGTGRLTGTFDLTEMTFQGKAWGTIQY